MTPSLTTPVLIAGAGIGGLATALALHARGVDCRVIESSSELRPLGVGINLLPHAVRALDEVGAAGLGDGVIETAALSYYNRHGQLIWSEPRGRACGYRYPQFSLHRGALQMHLLRLVRERLGDAAVTCGSRVAGFFCEDDHVVVQVGPDRRSGRSIRAGLLVGADGIHSTIRRQLHPADGGPRFSGRMLWRAITNAEPFLDGRTMIMAGHQDQKFVAYPIGPVGPDGRQPINWIAELRVDRQAPPPQDWSRSVTSTAFADRFADWRFGWLDIPALISGADAIYEYPMSDRDPLAHWGHGRVTLLGDAAHPMYPIGSNGATQAILDAAALADCLSAQGLTVDALATYEAARRPPTSEIVLLNRANGPEQVMQIAEERAPEGFGAIEDVIPRAELEQIADRYKQTAGFAIDQVNRPRL